MKDAGKKIAILGAGASGIAAARLALAGGAAWVGVFDSGDPAKLDAAGQTLRAEGVETGFGEAALRAPGGLDLVVVSPGIDTSWPIARSFAVGGAPMLGEIEFAWERWGGPVAAITGTNGKTTTTELTAAVLNGAGCRTVPAGNYGTAFSEVVLAGNPLDLVTLELSSFQLETIVDFRPEIAVWMNFAPDHLDRYPDVGAYLAAKLRIFENQTPDDFAVLNAAEIPEAALAARPVTFSAFGAEGADFAFEDGWILHRSERVLNFRECRLRGRHNAENAMAAMAVARCRGIDFEAMRETIRGYAAPPHRCQWVGEVGGVTFVNDSKATNLHALRSSLRGQEEPVVLIAGGKNKGLDFSELKSLAADTVTRAIAIGEIAEEICRAWHGAVPCETAATLDEAVAKAAAAAAPGQTVLFSPGTSSFDMFGGYEERGRRFAEAVARLG